MSKTQGTEILVNNRVFYTSQSRMTGAAIKTLAGIPMDYSLYVVHQSESVPVMDAEEIDLEQGAQFRAIPAATFGNTPCCLLV